MYNETTYTHDCTYYFFCIIRNVPCPSSAGGQWVTPPRSHAIGRLEPVGARAGRIYIASLVYPATLSALFTLDNYPHFSGVTGELVSALSAHR
eukprot:1195171-Prorocentrum_minimum.AAC.4